MQDPPSGEGERGRFSTTLTRVMTLSPPMRYGIAFGIAAAATLLRLGLEPVWGTRFTFIVFFPAVMASAWLGGLWPGITTTLCSAVAATYFWIEPAHSWHVEDKTELLGVATFVALGVMISALNEAWRRGAVRIAGSEARLRVTLSSIGDAVITTDRTGRVTQLNPVAQALTGWSEPEAAGRLLEDVFVIVDERSRYVCANPVQRVLREGVVSGLANHTVLMSRDGREIPVDDSAAPIRTADGTIAGVVLVFRDVTERRRAERESVVRHQAERAARLEAEAAVRQLQLVVQAGRMGTWQWTIATGQVAWSPALEAIHGWAPGTFPGTQEAFRSEIHPDDRERVLQAISDAVERRRDHHVEYRIVRRDGAIRWVEGRGQLFLDEQGRPQRMVGVCLDVTERRQGEERMQLAVEAAPTAMIITDRQGKILFVNALTAQLLGYAREELVGMTVDDLVPAGLRVRHAEHRAAFFSDLRRRPMGAGRELHALRKDGSEVPVEIGLSPFQTAEGVLVLAAVTDITDRKRLERERAEVLAREQAVSQELARVNRSKDAFLATLSHELRNPLAPIRNAVHFLRMKGSAEPDAINAHSIIERQVSHLARLVDDLLDVSRIGQDRLELRKEHVPLSTVIETALESSRPLIEQRRQQLVVTSTPGPVWVDADVVRLAQVLTNLLNNAAKFTPEGGRIELAAEHSRGEATVRVRDDGQGLEPATIERLFEMFYQGEQAREGLDAGLGIGLALARQLTRLHGGTLEAKSAGRGLGSEFVLRIPAIPAPAQQPLTVPPERSPNAAPSSAISYRILVADDNLDSAESLAMVLRLAGHEIRMAKDGAQACDVAAAFQPHVAVLDIGMPHMNGYEAALRIREQPGGKDVVLVALTGWGQPTDRQRAEDAGFTVHLTKPVDPAALVTLVSAPRSPRVGEA